MRFLFSLTMLIMLSMEVLPAWALTLDQAWNQIKKSHPAVAAAEANINAAEGQQTQAGLLPNPTFNTVQGNVPGFGSYSDNPNSQSTYLVSQLIETGGKRNGRKSIADAEYTQAKINYQINSAELYSQTVDAFLNVAEAEEKLKLNKIVMDLNKRTVSTVKHRINAGRASDLDMQSANIAFSNSHLENTTIKSELSTARYSLAKLWNGAENDIHELSIPTLSKMPLRNLSYYLEKINKNWDIKASVQQQNIAKAQMKLENAKKYPDVTLGVGIDHYYQHSDPKGHNAVMAEVSIPIPIFDRNQGNIVSASQGYNKSLAEAQNKELMLKRAIVNAYQTATQAKNQIDILNSSVLSQSRTSLNLAKSGYESGRYSYLDLLNAQQKLIDANMREINALFLYRRAWFTLQILTGRLPATDML